MVGEKLIVTQHKTDPIIIAGHSHVSALIGGREWVDVMAPDNIAGYSHVGGVVEGDTLLLPVEGQDRIFGLHGPWPHTENYWNALTRYASGHSIALLWEGNQHNSLFLVEQPLRFDFLPQRLQSLPVEANAVIVPEALIRAKFQSLLGALHDVLTDLKAQTHSRIALVGTPPPPKGDNGFLRDLLPPEFGMYLNLK